MNRRSLVLGLLAVVVVGGGAAAAVYYGIGPAPGGDDDRVEITDFPTATPAPTATGGDGGDGPSAPATTTPTPPFTLSVDEVTECGQTCRDVTVTLTNTRDEPATGVVVYTRIFAGQDNTDPDDLIWETREDVGDLDAGGSNTRTMRVELSLSEGLQVQNADGWITILTTVDSADETVTFRSSEQVA